MGLSHIILLTKIIKMVQHFAKVNEQEIRDLDDQTIPKNPENINSIWDGDI